MRRSIGRRRSGAAFPRGETEDVVIANLEAQVEKIEALAEARPHKNLEQLTELVTQAAALFYLVESPVNPGVQTYWDALHYIATSLSVGYANIFPVTAAGKAIGAAVMMIGPALSARALD
jgi:hypothetical protein